MKLLIIFLVVSTVTTGVFTKKRRGGYKEALESCSQYIDVLLSRVMADHSAPITTDDSLIIFHRKVVMVDVKGEVKLAPAHVIGLNKLQRTSPCAMSFENDRLKLSARLKIPDIAFNTTGTLKFIKMHPEIAVKINSSDIIVNMAFTLNFTTGKEALLTEFNVSHFNEIHTRIDGLGVMKFIKSTVENRASTLFKLLIKDAFKDRIQYLVAEEFNAHPFSLEEFDIDENEIVGTTQDVSATTPFADNIPTDKTTCTIEDADKYIDSVIENRFIVEAINNRLDPYSLEDVQIDNAFIQTEEKPAEGVSNKENNTLKLRNGHIEGLFKLKRISHCTKPKSRDSNITFVCNLGFDEIEVKYEASNREDVFDFEMIASVINTKFMIRITSNETDNIPHLKQFALCNTGTFTVKAHKVITDSTCFSDRPYNEEPVLRHFRVSLAKVLSGTLKEVLSSSVYRSPLHFLNL